MQTLIETYTLKDIILFVIVFAIAIKGFVSFWDWGYERLKKVFKKETDQEQEKDFIQEQVDKNKEGFQLLKSGYEHLQSEIESILEKINLLIESDKDDIKSFITKEHHRFCYDLKWIDDYSMDCIEKRYKHYKDEGGNSFIHKLMEELRALDKVPPQED